MNKYLRISPADKVAVATSDFTESKMVNVDGNAVKIKNPIPTGHKFAIRSIDYSEYQFCNKFDIYYFKNRVIYLSNI